MEDLDNLGEQQRERAAGIAPAISDLALRTSSRCDNVQCVYAGRDAAGALYLGKQRTGGPKLVIPYLGGEAFLRAVKDGTVRFDSSLLHRKML